MASIPYLVAHARLKPFLNKIQDVGTPSVVDNKWLTQIGFGTENDRRLQPLLEFLGFIDQTGKPTPKWAAYRNKSRAKQVMAQSLREAYSDLFHTYPDAWQRSDNDLLDFFRSSTGMGAGTLTRMLTTFKLLCDVADFSSESAAGPAPTPNLQGQTVVSGPDSSPGVEVSGTASNGASNEANVGPSGGGIRNLSGTLGTGVTLNINIQLTVPDTTDEKVYDNFFAALKKHLLS